MSVRQQIFDQLRKSEKILIALPEKLTADSLSAGLALQLFLRKLQKEAVVASSGSLPENLRFLPGADGIKSSIGSGSGLVVTVDATIKKLEEISYHTTDDKVHIYLKSKNQPFTPQDLSFTEDKLPLDLIVVLEAQSLESLGALFRDHADLFYQTPKINIDHKAGNELFGAVNLVELAATSIGEILAGLLEEFEQGLIDEDIATCLLAGIITKTRSFQQAQTTPEAFLKASRLIGAGGRQQEIIKNIYKTKSLALLKLWGRCLARLKTVGDLSLVYSSLNAGDFEKSEASGEEILPALKELLDNLSGYQVAGIFAEQVQGVVRLVLAIYSTLPLEKITEALEIKTKPVTELGQYQIFEVEWKDLSLAEAEQRLLFALQPLKTFLGSV